MKTKPKDELLTLRFVGPKTAAVLHAIDINTPADLQGQDPFAMYDDLNARTGKRYDPCVLDVFMSLVADANGEPKRAWWDYTAERKRALAERHG